MTVSARWYAARAAVGMPLAAASSTAFVGSPFTPGASESEPDRLAGASMASAGTVLPSGSVPSPPSADVALLPARPTPTRLAVQAADSTASGTKVAAFWRRPNLASLIVVSLVLDTPGGFPPRTGTPSTKEVTHGLRRSVPSVTWVTTPVVCSLHDTADRRGAEPDVTSPPTVGDNESVTPPATVPPTGSEALFARARAVTPGGVNSPVRAFNAVGGTPRFIRSGRGAWLTDVDGNEYVDLVCSWGALLLGHAHPEVQEAIAAAVARGTSYGTPTEPEVELAEELVARTPIDKVRFVSSGTEATMSAIRLARGFTGRDVVVKFAGCYHGHVDALLAAAGSGLATFAIPGTPGVPESSTALTLVLPYNDRAAVTAAFAEHGDRIACLITEAAPGNMGVVPPLPGFNAFLAETCAAHGALFVSDEVMTGFRASKLGQWGLDGAHEGWRPDLMTFGKVMGGGLPAAAFGGRADVMSQLAPEGPVYQAGTLAGNPVATTAGLATLRLATDEVYERISLVAETISTAAGKALTEAGVPHVVQATGTMFSVFFTAEQVRDFAAASTQDTAAYAAFFHAMLDRGVHLPPSAYEAWFLSSAHDDRAVETVLDALPARRGRGGRKATR